MTEDEWSTAVYPAQLYTGERPPALGYLVGGHTAPTEKPVRLLDALGRELDPVTPDETVGYGSLSIGTGTIPLRGSYTIGSPVHYQWPRRYYSIVSEPLFSMAASAALQSPEQPEWTEATEAGEDACRHCGAEITTTITHATCGEETKDTLQIHTRCTCGRADASPPVRSLRVLQGGGSAEGPNVEATLRQTSLRALKPEVAVADPPSHAQK
jgi:hypothetical protein